ncbi:MAG TPA: ABC transporter permease, partial [Gemmatimonadaceae bacterium]
MRRQIAARALQSLIVVIIVTTISFFVIRSASGDPFSYDSPSVTPKIREQWRHQFGYDRPLVEQYMRYAASVAHGQLGYSVSRHKPVSEALAETVPNTLLLTGLSLLLSFSLAVVIGVVQAVKRDSWFDRITSGILMFFYSLPDFWGALMVLLAFAYWLPIFPAGGMTDAMHDYMTGGTAAWDRITHLVLPVFAFALLQTAAYARYQRAAMLEVLPSDYIRTARAKGLTEREIIWRHALRTALTPMITLLGLSLPALLGGA